MPALDTFVIAVRLVSRAVIAARYSAEITARRVGLGCNGPGGGAGRQEAADIEHLLIDRADEHGSGGRRSGLLEILAHDLAQPEAHGPVAQLVERFLAISCVQPAEVVLLETRADHTGRLLLHDRE